MSVFVTVGTTSFDDLIQEVSSDKIKQLLQDLGYSKLVIQLGRGEFSPEKGIFGKLTVGYYDYKSSIASDIATADLVISHAGAGSCLEVLAAKKPLIVVVNEKLMDNHQYELAEQLQKGQHLLYCTPSTLEDTIKTIQETELTPFVPAETEKFGMFLDKHFGLV